MGHNGAWWGMVGCGGHGGVWWGIVGHGGHSVHSGAWWGMVGHGGARETCQLSEHVWGMFLTIRFNVLFQ